MFSHIHPLILPLAFFFFINSTIGVIGNGIMLICFFRTKRLRSPCHILISLTCICDLLHLCAQFVYCVHLFGNMTSSQAQCFYMLTIPLSGVGASGPLILAMGVDRLIAVKFPTKYRLFQQEPKHYILGQLVFPIAYTAILLYYGFANKIVDEKLQVACAVPLALMGTSFQFFTYSSALIYFLVVIVYGIVYFLLKSNQASARFKSVFRSILVTVGFVLFGWVTTTLTNTLSYEITSVAFTAQLMQMYAGITVNFAAASNAFIFYAINSEYREVIKSLFGCKNKTNTPAFEASSTMVSVSKTSKIQRRKSTMASIN
ncbi:G-protein coupled receptors family 1 profile domain-containing protein [Caenorhabditis elegans]|uniref:G-protein coupled receptors family 1 profile domain-containing protein n=1 Tax=Caenorhabditis elegans TaxID=6239 RepID=Q18769_CAEEL|nr:G-protein coupled receptors family 1 profile domain-containing protein [Caenorhabditis elegans]CAB01639.2 G-protein coupled receptors family 1 profile domain-containing protein [Caenorhabditis elegans]|eukprot:NP_505611.2 Serpentine Receptor, class SX [Caenorhabditis elegans]